ncbi:hypothetical protein DFJ77DRAFT_552174 [Powellomyces hirtus]|nr:hypothetical protein DFJ77DRAFT_552174 [Powellomyces hirtus]
MMGEQLPDMDIEVLPWQPEDQFQSFDHFLSSIATELDLQLPRAPRSEPVPNVIHPLAVNTFAIKAEFTALRDQIIAQNGGQPIFNSSGESLEQRVGISIAQYRRLLQQQAYAFDAAFPLRSALDHCLSDVLTDPAAFGKLTTERVIRKLQTLTEQLQLQFYSSPHVEDDSTMIVTICGMIFVVDIEVNFEGTITKARLSYASDTHSQDQQHELADKLLAETLRKGDFLTFKTSLSNLAFLDGHAGFHQLKCIENDLISIYGIELTNSANNPESVLMEGHGIPLMHCEQFGPSLVFWGTPGERCDIDWSKGTDATHMSDAFAPGTMYKAYIQLELYQPIPVLGAHRNQFLVPGNPPENPINMDGNESIVQGTSWRDISPLSFYLPMPPGSQLTNITFFMDLTPPIVACTSLARRVGALVGLCPDGEVPSVPVDLSNTNRYATFVELLLRPDVDLALLFADGSAFAAEGPALSSELSSTPIRQTYSFAADPAVPGVLITKIPFTHPNQLHPILTDLRRQLTFNHLFRSCFNSQTAEMHTCMTGSGQTAQFTLQEWTPLERLVFGMTYIPSPSAPPVRRRIIVEVGPDCQLQIVTVDVDEAGAAVEESSRTAGLGVMRLVNTSLDLVLVFEMLMADSVGDTGHTEMNGVLINGVEEVF